MSVESLERDWFAANERLDEIRAMPRPLSARLIVEAQALRWRIRDIEERLERSAGS